MLLEGVVTNVANFGAFVDIGVHQDGLVHVSQLADRFVKDPREVVKAGDIVKVKVVEVDLERKRIALTMKSAGAVPAVRSSGPKPERKVEAATPAPRPVPGRDPRRHRAPRLPQRLRNCRKSRDAQIASRRGDGSPNRAPNFIALLAAARVRPCCPLDP